MLLFWVTPLVAQTVDDYFHRSANSYVNGRSREAKRVLEEGIQRYPGNPKLSALLSKIQEEESNNQQQENQQNQEDQQEEQQNQEQESKEQKQQQQEKQEEGDEDEQDRQQQQAQKGEQQEISKEDAERILDALKNEEEDLLRKNKTTRRGRAFRGKDW
ncbi:MAG: hypothetical protein ACE5IY_05305 [bacterium]